MKNSKIRSLMAAALATLLLTMTAVSCGDNAGDGTGTSDDTSVSTVENDASTNGAGDATNAGNGATTNAPTTNNTPETGSGSSDEELYTVKFLNGTQVVYETKAKSGDLVDIPDDPTSADPRFVFNGWTGMDEADYNSGKVEVFSENKTFTASWYQMFGTTNKYTATQVKNGTTITVDGAKDAAYNDATAIDITTAINGTPGATAKAYLMWDEANYYLFIEVTDATATAYTSGAVEAGDGVEIRMDILHSYEFAPTYSGGWGGAYRGEPGPMVEAGFKIGAGVDTGTTFGSGNEAYWEWWSHAIAESCTNMVNSISTMTDTGYTVEYQLPIFPDVTAEAYRPHVGQVIGLGLQVFDNGGTIAIEEINSGMNADARNLSNVELIANPNP